MKYEKDGSVVCCGERRDTRFCSACGQSLQIHGEFFLRSGMVELIQDGDHCQVDKLTVCEVDTENGCLLVTFSQGDKISNGESVFLQLDMTKDGTVELAIAKCEGKGLDDYREVEVLRETVWPYDKLSVTPARVKEDS